MLAHECDEQIAQGLGLVAVDDDQTGRRGWRGGDRHRDDVGDAAVGGRDPAMMPSPGLRR
jgi:hypothetical protein